jgi:hypothetical protein
MRSHRMIGVPSELARWGECMGVAIRSRTPPHRPCLFPVPCPLFPASPKRTPPAQSPPQNRPRSIPTPNSPSSRPERSVVEGPPHFVVACFSCHPERSLARTLRQTQSKDLRLLVLRRHSGAARISVFAFAVAVACSSRIPDHCPLLFLSRGSKLSKILNHHNP